MPSLEPEQFKQIYIQMFKLDETQSASSPLYYWRPMSTYIRRPPYWEGALAAPRTLKAMRPLAILGDNITTDHLSPSNAILASSAAGEYLTKMGVPEEDFNSYATHRGDHLTAQRATFANPKLFNEMVKENGQIKQGSLARIEPEGKVTRMWEAIETYMNRKQPLIVIAGADYKGVRLAGVEAIVAEGFERIHRTNLVGMGVLQLEFKPGANRHSLALDGTELFDVVGEIRPGADLALVVTRQNGEKLDVAVTCRLDTADEVHVYQAGTLCASLFGAVGGSMNETVPQIRIPATYMRGGTSKGVFFRLNDLPLEAQLPGAARDALLLRVIGSPDPYGKQIDGMGGATSSTSKTVIVSASSRTDHDVDYLDRASGDR